MILLKDTLIMAGSGRALVMCVGDHTLVEKEKIVSEFSTDCNLTPLQIKLEHFSVVLGFIANVWAFVAFVLFTLYWVLNVGISSTDFISLDALLAMVANF